MVEIKPTGRRRVLTTIGAGATTLLAGCSSLAPSDDDESTNDGGNNTTNGNDTTNGNETTNGDNNETDGTDNGTENGEEQSGAHEVGLIPTVDSTELQQIQQAVLAGEISQEEAQEQQRALIQGEIDTLVTRLEDESDVEIIEELPDLGGIRVSGSADELLDIVEWEEAEALVSTAVFDEPAVPQP